MAWRGLRGLWSILDPVVINVDAPPDVVLRMLDSAAHPSIERLHLREVFVEGRRYFMQATDSGFRMVTTSKTLLNRTRRTEASAVLTATLASAGDGKTSIAVRARLRPVSFLYTFWMPVIMIYLLLPVPWPRVLAVGIIVAIFGFAWGTLHYGAALEANEMVFFIRKTFENLPKFTPGVLSASSADMTVNGSDFEVLWDKFVREHKSSSEAAG